MTPRTKAVLAASAIFVLGLGLGSLATTLVGMHVIRKSMLSPEGIGLIHQAMDRLRSDIVAEVQPNPSQLKEIDRELSELERSLGDTRRQFRREMLLDLRTGSQAIRRTLDDERRARFDALLSKRLGAYGLKMPATDQTQTPSTAK